MGLDPAHPATTTVGMASSHTIERVAEARLPTEVGAFRIIGYRSLNSTEEFIALVKGELRADRPSLVRIHSQCLTGKCSVPSNATAGDNC